MLTRPTGSAETGGLAHAFGNPAGWRTEQTFHFFGAQDFQDGIDERSFSTKTAGDEHPVGDGFLGLNWSDSLDHAAAKKISDTFDGGWRCVGQYLRLELQPEFRLPNPNALIRHPR